MSGRGDAASRFFGSSYQRGMLIFLALRSAHPAMEGALWTGHRAAVARCLCGARDPFDRQRASAIVT